VGDEFVNTPGLEQVSFELHGHGAMRWFTFLEALMRKGFWHVGGIGVRYMNNRGDWKWVDAIERPLTGKMATLVGYKHCRDRNNSIQEWYAKCPGNRIMGELTFLRPEGSSPGPALWDYGPANADL
jgi:hypothetical protein